MKNDWGEAEVSLVQWKQTDLSIMDARSISTLTKMTDDHFITTTNMKGNSSEGLVQDQITKWEQWLIDMNDFLDSWT